MTREYPVLIGHCSVCKAPMMSKDRWSHMGRAAAERWYPGYTYHGARGLCAAHHAREKRTGDPRGIEARPKSTRTCSREGCDEPHDARDLCRAHYHQARKRGDFETRPKRSYEDTLDDWVLIRDYDGADVRRAADRMGMTFSALDKALYRARKRGDLRGSLTPFAHDMRRHAA